MEDSDLLSLADLLESVGSSVLAEDVASRTGVTQLADLAELEFEDFIATGMLPLHARRLLKRTLTYAADDGETERSSLLRNAQDVVPEEASLAAMPVSVSLSPRTPSATGVASCVNQSRTEADLLKEKGCPRMRALPLCGLDPDSGSEDDDRFSAEDSSSEDDDDTFHPNSEQGFESEDEPRPRGDKRRRLSRYGEKRLENQENVFKRGTSRVTLCDPLSSGKRVDRRRLPRLKAGEGCKCHDILKSAESELEAAKRTAAEKSVMAARNQNGVASEYNYVRLKSVLFNYLFNSNGGWAVHEKCAREKLCVSNRFLADVHRQAVELFGAPVRRMKKSDIGSRRDELMENIILPSDCMLTRARFYDSASSDYLFDILLPRDRLHGLVGRPSNRAKTHERALFRSYVANNRSPTGRTADHKGRYHGAVFYLDSKWTVLKSLIARRKREDVRERECPSTIVAKGRSFCDDFSRACFEASGKNVATSTVYLWFTEDFSSRISVDGAHTANKEHTTLFPHKSDACAFCETNKRDSASASKSLQREKQQHDRTIPRLQAIRRHEEEVSDLSFALEAHLEAAAGAIEHHNSCIKPAAAIYRELSERFQELCNKKVNASDPRWVQFTRDASSSWLDVSSDYQQDKAVPAWNRSPQPGPTYYLSGMTNYVHIFVLHSCGEAARSDNDDTRLSRNIVYIREESVAGSKGSDDTLSTLSDCLVGSQYPASLQPEVYRKGYDALGFKKSGELVQ